MVLGEYMPDRDYELLRRLALLNRLTQAARDSLHAPKGDPLKDALETLTPDERSVLDAMRAESTPGQVPRSVN